MLQELNKESLLLLYVADELSAADRAEVDRMLAGDGALRAQLEALDESAQSFSSGMLRLDDAPIVGEAMMRRRIGQAMRQRMADQLVLSAVPAPANQDRSRYPMWAYPGIAAAVLLVAFVSWWGHQTASPLVIAPTGGAGQVASQWGSEDATQVAEGLRQNFENSNPTQPATSVASLNAAEDQIAELSQSDSRLRLNDGNE